MSQQTINIGAAPNDHTGDTIRSAFNKANLNFTEIYGANGPCWSSGAATTLTTPNTVTGSSTNIFKMVFNNLGVTQTDGAGIWLQNSTLANVGAQQSSPSVTWEGQGNGSNSIQASQTVKYIADVLPVQGASNAAATWRLRASLNGGAYADILTLGTSGTMTFTSGASTMSFTSTNINASVGTINLVTGGTTRASITNTGSTFTQGNLAASWSPAITSTPGAHTNMTAGTEFKVHVFGASTQTWANGSSTLATQRYNHFLAPTVNAGSGNTITDTFNVSIDDPTNGSGTTTNLWSLGVGKMRFGGIPKFAGTNTTGAGSAALGGNSPATTNTAPYTWIQIITSDGSTAYIPVWK